MKIKFLKAFNGDSILISFQDSDKQNRNILIDGGTASTYQYVDKRTKRLQQGELQITIEKLRQKGEKIDLLILTHVDEDHIGGILKWFEGDLKACETIGKIWFNSGRLIAKWFDEQEVEENLLKYEIPNGTKTSIGHGVTFEDFIEKHDIWDRKLIKNGQELTEMNIQFKILSPSIKNLELLLKKWVKEKPNTLTSGKQTDYKLSLKELLATEEKFEEDTSIHNGSSIAFILTYDSKNLLFLGDAHPSVVIKGLNHFGYTVLNPLKAEIVKISHHGSKANTTRELLDHIDCEKFVISSNGYTHNLPHKICLARIVSSKLNATMYFNYPEKINEIFSAEDFQQMKFVATAGDQEISI